MRILVVEDERALARVVARGLTQEGHAVDVAHDLATARYNLEENEYALVVLDLGLPDGDGTDLCREIRERGDSSAVLMLTARDAVPDRIGGLDSGADDYLTKPFDFGELTARVRALGRRPRSAQAPVLWHEDLRVDTVARSVHQSGVLVPLTTREFALLHHLMSSAGGVVSRTELMDSLWDTNYDGLSNVVDVHIRNLRRKLDRPDRALPIETVRGAGYRFAAGVSVAGPVEAL